MEINKEFWVTLAWTIINILVLYIVLKKLLFKPVTKYLDDRSNGIKDALDKAEEARVKIEHLEEEQNAKLKEYKEQGQQLIASYQKKAEDEYNKVISKAQEDSKQMVEKTRGELAAEKQQIMTDLKNDITSLVLQASEKVIKENVDNSSNRKLVEEFIDNQE